MGGTLVDTYPAVDAVLRQVVLATGAEVSDREVAALTRRSTGVAIETLARRFGITEEAFRSAYADLKDAWRSEPPPMMDGAPEAMATARELGGLNLVVTHRDRESATTLLEGLGLSVDDMLCAPDGFARKPAPDMYVEVVRRHGLRPEECLGVGDRPIDIQAAAGAGVDGAMLITPGLDLDDGGARWSITSLRELPPLLG